jgi:uncharacterized membrane protein
MANAKSKARVAAQQRARAQAKKAVARTAPPVRATPNSSAALRTSRLMAASIEADSDALEAQELIEPAEERPRYGPPAWFGWTTFVLAILGLGISVYETYSHYAHSKLLFCPTGTGTFNCTAVTTSSQSMVFNVIPVAVLGLAFYLVAVPLFSPWAWRMQWRGRQVGLLRLGSVIVGMGFVMYLIYAEVYQIAQVCEYCTGVHIVTFLLFCMTVVAAALWGLAPRRDR